MEKYIFMFLTILVICLTITILVVVLSRLSCDKIKSITAFFSAIKPLNLKDLFRN